MQSLPEDFKLSPGIIVIDPQERIVNLHQSDIVASHTLILPKATRLINSLRVTGEAILRLTRRRRQSSSGFSTSPSRGFANTSTHIGGGMKYSFRTYFIVEFLGVMSLCWGC